MDIVMTFCMFEKQEILKCKCHIIHDAASRSAWLVNSLYNSTYSIVCICMLLTSPVILHMYDEEKSEVFSANDMQQLMNILHNIEAGETVRGNVKDSWNRLTFADDNLVDYNELSEIVNRFPKLFHFGLYPVSKFFDFLL